MCGITGFIDYHGLVTETELLAASARLQHRGGSSSGNFVEQKEKYTVGIATERLSTIDISAEAQQPFHSACGNYVISFNGTIYNYQELRLTMIRQGAIFHTLSDTEVLLACFKKWGTQMFEHIDGTFAFAIIDRRRNQMILARDQMGVKPLYWFKNNNFFVFASEIKALLHYPIVKNIHRPCIETYLRQGYFIGEETIFEGIKNFKKQHYMVIDLASGNYMMNRFESRFNNLVAANTEDGLIKQLNNLITESVLRRYTADLSTGVMLSGGYDSATVAAILQKNQVQRIKTFTLGFRDLRLNEASRAKNIANYLNTNHHEYFIEPQDAVEMLEKLPEILDEPSGDSGAIALAFLAKQSAADNIKVLLGAEGGDELFAGYTNYKLSNRIFCLSRRLPNFLKKILSSLSKHRQNKLNEVLFTDNLGACYESICSFFPKNEISLMLNKRLEPNSFYEFNTQNIKGLLRFDLEYYLPNDLMMKADRCAMHYSIDNRDALLSLDLVNFAQSLDAKWLYPKQGLKHLLKQVCHQYLPKAMMDNPKQGFSIPLVAWMSTIYKPFIEKHLSPYELNKHQFFDIIEVFKLKNRFFASPNGTDARKLWLLLQFQMWYDKHFDS